MKLALMLRDGLHDLFFTEGFAEQFRYRSSEIKKAPQLRCFMLPLKYTLA